MVTTGIPTRKIMHKNTLLNCTILNKPFSSEGRPQLMNSVRLKKLNLPEVITRNLQRNGSHLNSDNLQITLDIQFQCKRVKDFCQLQ
jgi:hypothetical protein